MNSRFQQLNVDIDYRAMRVIIGLIAFLLPIVVWLVSTDELTSISAAYHTNAQDIFVGTLFIVGAYFIVYNGHEPIQALFAKVAAVAAFLTALFPTPCDGCVGDVAGAIHYISAGTLFGILSIFCLVFFQRRATERIKLMSEKDSRYPIARRAVYVICGVVILLCILVLVVTGFILEQKTFFGINFFYWAEAVALGSFGFAWFVAGKILILLRREDEIELKPATSQTAQQTQIESHPPDPDLKYGVQE